MVSKAGWLLFQDGGWKSKKHNFEIRLQFCVLSFAMSLTFDQQHLPKMEDRFKMADQNQFFKQNSESFQYFFNLSFAFVRCR
jgi:hypothetical protein